MACASYTESDLGRIKVVTSATRPTGASRYVGQRIYETDTLRELLYDGTGWVIMSEPNQSWTPSFGSVTGGSTALAGYYQRSDGYIFIWGRLTFGAAPSALSGPTIALPVQASSLLNGQLNVSFGDTGTTVYPGLHDSSTTNPTLYALAASGSYVSLANVSLTVPFTFGATDTIAVSGRYLMASRYS